MAVGDAVGFADHEKCDQRGHHQRGGNREDRTLRGIGRGGAEQRGGGGVTEGRVARVAAEALAKCVVPAK